MMNKQKKDLNVQLKEGKEVLGSDKTIRRQHKGGKDRWLLWQRGGMVGLKGAICPICNLKLLMWLLAYKQMKIWFLYK